MTDLSSTLASSLPIDFARAEVDAPIHGPWAHPPKQPKLEQSKIHLWRVGLDVEDDATHPLRATLCPDELSRADRYRFEDHRRRYIVRHGALRAILSSYTNQHAHELTFKTNSFGKPRLTDAQADLAICFNMTHSADLAVVAITNRLVGVDIERLNPATEIQIIAKRFFSPAECSAIQTVPAVARREAFFRCWTRKEAYIKAVGQGLSIPLDRFEVSLNPDHPPALLRVKDNPTEVNRWSMVNLKPGENYVGALVVQR